MTRVYSTSQRDGKLSRSKTFQGQAEGERDGRFADDHTKRKLLTSPTKCPLYAAWLVYILYIGSTPEYHVVSGAVRVHICRSAATRKHAHLFPANVPREKGLGHDQGRGGSNMNSGPLALGVVLDVLARRAVLQGAAS